MAQVIKIKSSSDNATFPTLAAGELAYSADSAAQKLAIGHPDGSSGNLIIGGKLFTDMLDHTAGTLTASSAIITDASNKIDQLIVDDITINGSTISDAGAFDLDVGGNITFDADGGTITFADGGSSLGTITSSGYSGNAGTATLATTVTVTDDSGSTARPVVFHNESNGLLDDTGAFTYKPSTGEVTATKFIGALTGNVTGNVTGSSGSTTGNAATATVATTVTVTDNENTSENNVILFGAGAAGSGNIGVEADGDLTYNPSTGTVTATAFAGALTGNVTGNVTGSSGSTTGNAATATLASTVTVSDSTANTAFPIVFHDESNALLDDTGALTYNPSNGTLTATTFSGSFTGTISGTASNVTVTDSTASTNFPIVFHDESNALLDDTGAATYNPGTGTLTVPNLTVSGTTTQVNTETITLDDNIIVLNNNKTGAPSNSDNAGLEIERGDGVNVFIRYNDGGTGANATDGRWQFAIPSNSSDNAVTTSNILSVANFESEITTLDGGSF